VGFGRGCHAAGNGRRGVWHDSGGGRPTSALERRVQAARCAGGG
jgi:hypothetical protein